MAKYRAVRDCKNYSGGTKVKKGDILILRPWKDADDEWDMESEDEKLFRSKDFEEVTDVKTIKATWKDGNLTVGSHSVTLCRDGLKLLGVDKVDATRTYEFEITSRVVKEVKPKVLYKKGDVIVVKKNAPPGYNITVPRWKGIVVEDCLDTDEEIKVIGLSGQYILETRYVEAYKCDGKSKGRS